MGGALSRPVSYSAYSAEEAKRRDRDRVQCSECGSVGGNKLGWPWLGLLGLLRSQFIPRTRPRQKLTDERNS